MLAKPPLEPIVSGHSTVDSPSPDLQRVQSDGTQQTSATTGKSESTTSHSRSSSVATGGSRVASAAVSDFHSSQDSDELGDLPPAPIITQTPGLYAASSIISTAATIGRRSFKTQQNADLMVDSPHDIEMDLPNIPREKSNQATPDSTHLGGAPRKFSLYTDTGAQYDDAREDRNLGDDEDGEPLDDSRSSSSRSTSSTGGLDSPSSSKEKMTRRSDPPSTMVLPNGSSPRKQRFESEAHRAAVERHDQHIVQQQRLTVEHAQWMPPHPEVAHASAAASVGMHSPLVEFGVGGSPATTAVTTVTPLMVSTHSPHPSQPHSMLFDENGIAPPQSSQAMAAVVGLPSPVRHRENSASQRIAMATDMDALSVGGAGMTSAAAVVGSAATQGPRTASHSSHNGVPPPMLNNHGSSAMPHYHTAAMQTLVAPPMRNFGRSAPVRFRGAAKISSNFQFIPPDPFSGDDEIAQWSVGDVQVWVSNLEGGLAQYSGVFVENHIKGQDLLQLTESDLLDHLQVRSIGHRKLFMECIQELKQCVIVEVGEERFLVPPNGAVLRCERICVDWKNSVAERTRDEIVRIAADAAAADAHAQQTSVDGSIGIGNGLLALPKKELRKTRPVISHFTGSFLPNQISVIIGTDEKSELIKVLSGYEVSPDYHISGHIFFNGSPVAGSLCASGLASYIHGWNDHFDYFTRATVADLVNFHVAISGAGIEYGDRRVKSWSRRTSFAHSAAAAGFSNSRYRMRNSNYQNKFGGFDLSDQTSEEMAGHVLRLAGISYPTKTRVCDLSSVSIRRLLISIDCVLYGIKIIFGDLILDELNDTDTNELMEMIFAFSRRLDVTFILTADHLKFSLLQGFVDQVIVIGESLSSQRHRVAAAVRNFGADAAAETAMNHTSQASMVNQAGMAASSGGSGGSSEEDSPDLTPAAMHSKRRVKNNHHHHSRVMSPGSGIAAMGQSSSSLRSSFLTTHAMGLRTPQTTSTHPAYYYQSLGQQGRSGSAPLFRLFSSPFSKMSGQSRGLSSGIRAGGAAAAAGSSSLRRDGVAIPAASVPFGRIGRRRLGKKGDPMMNHHSNHAMDDINPHNNNPGMIAEQFCSSVRFSGHPDDLVPFFFKKFTCHKVSDATLLNEVMNNVDGFFHEHENPLEIIVRNVMLDDTLCDCSEHSGIVINPTAILNADGTTTTTNPSNNNHNNNNNNRNIGHNFGDVYFKYRSKPHVLNPSNADCGKPRLSVMTEFICIMNFILKLSWREFSLMYTLLRLIIYGLIIGGIFFNIKCNRYFLNERLLAVFIISCLPLTVIWPIMDYWSNYRIFWIKHLVFRNRIRNSSLMIGLLILCLSYSMLVGLMSFIPWEMDQLGSGNIMIFCRITLIQVLSSMIIGFITLFCYEFYRLSGWRLTAPIFTTVLLFSGALVHPGHVSNQGISGVILPINFMKYSLEYLLFTDAHEIHVDNNNNKNNSSDQCNSYEDSLFDRKYKKQPNIDVLVLLCWMFVTFVLFYLLFKMAVDTLRAHSSQFMIGSLTPMETIDVNNVPSLPVSIASDSDTEMEQGTLMMGSVNPYAAIDQRIAQPVTSRNSPLRMSSGPLIYHQPSTLSNATKDRTSIDIHSRRLSSQPIAHHQSSHHSTFTPYSKQREDSLLYPDLPPAVSTPQSYPHKRQSSVAMKSAETPRFLSSPALNKRGVSPSSAAISPTTMTLEQIMDDSEQKQLSPADHVSSSQSTPLISHHHNNVPPQSTTMVRHASVNSRSSGKHNRFGDVLAVHLDVEEKKESDHHGMIDDDLNHNHNQHNRGSSESSLLDIDTLPVRFEFFNINVIDEYQRPLFSGVSGRLQQCCVTALISSFNLDARPLLRCIAGVPTNERLWVEGRVLLEQGQFELKNQINLCRMRVVGYLKVDPLMPSMMTVQEIIRLALILTESDVPISRKYDQMLGNNNDNHTDHNNNDGEHANDNNVLSRMLEIMRLTLYKDISVEKLSKLEYYKVALIYAGLRCKARTLIIENVLAELNLVDQLEFLYCLDRWAKREEMAVLIWMNHCPQLALDFGYLRKVMILSNAFRGGHSLYPKNTSAAANATNNHNNIHNHNNNAGPLSNGHISAAESGIHSGFLNVNGGATVIYDGSTEEAIEILPTLFPVKKYENIMDELLETVSRTDSLTAQKLRNLIFDLRQSHIMLMPEQYANVDNDNQNNRMHSERKDLYEYLLEKRLNESQTWLEYWWLTWLYSRFVWMNPKLFIWALLRLAIHIFICSLAFIKLPHTSSGSKTLFGALNALLFVFILQTPSNHRLFLPLLNLGIQDWQLGKYSLSMLVLLHCWSQYLLSILLGLLTALISFFMIIAYNYNDLNDNNNHDLYRGSDEPNNLTVMINSLALFVLSFIYSAGVWDSLYFVLYSIGLTAKQSWFILCHLLLYFWLFSGCFISKTDMPYLFRLFGYYLNPVRLSVEAQYCAVIMPQSFNHDTLRGNDILVESGYDCAIGFDLSLVFLITIALRIIGGIILSYRFSSNMLFNPFYHASLNNNNNNGVNVHSSQTQRRSQQIRYQAPSAAVSGATAAAGAHARGHSQRAEHRGGAMPNGSLSSRAPIGRPIAQLSQSKGITLPLLNTGSRMRSQSDGHRQPLLPTESENIIMNGISQIVDHAHSGFGGMGMGHRKNNNTLDMAHAVSGLLQTENIPMPGGVHPSRYASEAASVRSNFPQSPRIAESTPVATVTRQTSLQLQRSVTMETQLPDSDAEDSSDEHFDRAFDSNGSTTGAMLGRPGLSEMIMAQTPGPVEQLL